MSVRYRIRTPEGQELSFATRDAFEEFVRSGDLSENDLVYDAQDGSWCSARTHPTVVAIEDEQAEGAPEGASQALPAVGAPSDPTAQPEAPVELEPGVDADLDLDLALAPELSAEEASRHFVKRMESERRTSIEFGESSRVEGLSMDDASTLGDMLTPAPVTLPQSGRGSRVVVSEDAVQRHGGENVGRPSRQHASPRTAHGSRAPGKKRGGRVIRVLIVFILVGALAAAVYFGAPMLQKARATDSDQPTPLETLPATPRGGAESPGD